MIEPVQQCLFGYRNGHRRLASSIELAPDDERLLLRLTDLSGPRLVSGFENYLSGYPLPSQSFYALAMTWYARELERPGCVWTHVLLVSENIPGKWVATHDLLKLFQRPTVDTIEDSGFDRQIVVEPTHETTHIPRELPIREILEGLYTSGKPVVVPAASSKSYDAMAFRLWAQQPGAIREAFTFCTGALDLLKWETEPFRLQVMPERVARQVRVEVFTADKSYPVHEKWPELATRGVLSTGEGGFWKFVRTYFEPAKKGGLDQDLQQVGKLAKAFMAVEEFENEGRDMATLVSTIAKLYPQPQSGLRVKSGLIGANSPLNLQARELDILLRSATFGQTVEAYKSLQPTFSDLAQRLWRLDAQAGYNLLAFSFSVEPTSNSTSIVNALLDEATVDELARFKPLPPGLLVTFGKHRPEVLSQPSYWSLPSNGDLAIEIAEMLSEQLSLEALFQSLSTARRYDLLVRVCRAKGARAVPSILRAIGSLDRKEEAALQMLTEELRPFVAEVTTFLRETHPKVNYGLLHVIGELLSPEANIIVKCTTVEDWCSLLDELPRKKSPQRVHAFAFGLALANISGSGYKLIKRSFDPVHDAAEVSELPYEHWSLIRDRLPEIPLWWDKCERIRRAVIAAYIHFDWPVASFPECTDHEKSLEDLIDSCRKTDEGRSLATRLRQLDFSSFPNSKRRVLTAGLR